MKAMASPSRIALFGTSADPPHLGHKSILTWLAQSFDHVAVWAADNPYKEKQSPIHNRAEMLRLLIETLPACEKVDVYQKLSDRYSINSITLARKIWPNARFSFVVGADLIAQLPRWYRAEAIFDQVDILIFPRPGYAIQSPALSDLRKLATVKIARPSDQYDVSSSLYRQRRCPDNSNQLASARSPAHLPSVVRDYITEHDLYPCPQPTPKARISTHR